MIPLNQDSVVGRWVEITMDTDHSAESFYGKGRIIHVFSNPPAKEAVAIQFTQESKKRFFRKNRNEYLILEFPLNQKYSVKDALATRSFARVLRPRRVELLRMETYTPRDTKPLGFAQILPLPS